MSIIKRGLLGSSMILIFAGAAMAQSDWSGFYAGVNFGGALGRATANTTTVFNPPGYFAASSIPAIETAGRQQLNADDFTGGVEAGVNAQIGRVVFGAETDYVSLRLSSNQSSSLPYPCCANSVFVVNQSYRTRWLFTARPRIGVVMGPAMLYVTGGVALTRVKYEELFTDNFAGANETGLIDKTKTGWVGGGGISYQFPAENWSVKAEYLYANFGRVTTTSNNLESLTPPPPVAFPSSVFTHSMALHTHIFRAGVDYRW